MYAKLKIKNLDAFGKAIEELQAAYEDLLAKAAHIRNDFPGVEIELEAGDAAEAPASTADGSD